MRAEMASKEAPKKVSQFTGLVIAVGLYHNRRVGKLSTLVPSKIPVSLVLDLVRRIYCCLQRASSQQQRILYLFSDTKDRNNFLAFNRGVDAGSPRFLWPSPDSQKGRSNSGRAARLLIRKARALTIQLGATRTR
jgi:hypothetical protein